MKLKAADIQRISEQLGAATPVELEPFLQCQDHCVSRETFSLFKDVKRDLLVTLPQPSEENLPEYYESEDYISHTDSKRNLLEIAYQAVKQFSIKRKVGLVSRVNQGQGSLLDVGCGTGDFLKACEDSGWSIAGIEPNEKARQLASDKGPKDQIRKAGAKITAQSNVLKKQLKTRGKDWKKTFGEKTGKAKSRILKKEEKLKQEILVKGKDWKKTFSEKTEKAKNRLLGSQNTLRISNLVKNYVSGLMTHVPRLLFKLILMMMMSIKGTSIYSS